MTNVEAGGRAIFLFQSLFFSSRSSSAPRYGVRVAAASTRPTPLPSEPALRLFVVVVVTAAAVPEARKDARESGIAATLAPRTARRRDEPRPRRRSTRTLWSAARTSPCLRYASACSLGRVHFSRARPDAPRFHLRFKMARDGRAPGGNTLRWVQQTVYTVQLTSRMGTRIVGRRT